jgi:hypothetical protein
MYRQTTKGYTFEGGLYVLFVALFCSRAISLHRLLLFTVGYRYSCDQALVKELLQYHFGGGIECLGADGKLSWHRNWSCGCCEVVHCAMCCEGVCSFHFDSLWQSWQYWRCFGGVPGVAGVNWGCEMERRGPG